MKDTITNTIKNYMVKNHPRETFQKVKIRSIDNTSLMEILFDNKRRKKFEV